MAHEMFLAEDFYGQHGNVYEAILAIAQRARQIGEEHRKEMDAYLSQVEMLEKFQDEEDTFDEPLKQKDPVLQFEKPTVLALREMIAEKLEVIRENEDEASLKEKAAFAFTVPGKLDLGSSDDEETSESSFPSKISLTDDDE